MTSPPEDRHAADSQRDDDHHPQPQAPGRRKPLRAERLRARLQRADLSLTTRIILFLVGWSLVLIGVAGLALPGIQGILTILIGAAILSVASETAYRLLRRLFKRWPRLWKRIDNLRSRVHDRLSRPGRGHNT